MFVIYNTYQNKNQKNDKNKKIKKGKDMRTSSQLNKTGTCERNSGSSMEGSSRTKTLAFAQKSVVMRMLKGEPIDDIAGEIDSILKEEGFVWENVEQRLENEANYEKRIKRFLNTELYEEKVFPEDLDADMTVDYFGESIEAKPDYFKVYGDRVEVCKITTSAYISEQEDLNRQEMYALGLCGEKLFPDKQVFVSRMHLRPSSAGEQNAYKLDANGNYMYPYDTGYRKVDRCVSTVELTESAKEVYRNAYEESKNNTCSPEECASCSQRNICHFEQAPISVDIEASVRPITDIRLSAEQRAATEFEVGTARANAGPGGGKTLVTAIRIANLLEKGYEPEDFCLLTYTNAGAEEMTARVMNYAASKGIPLDAGRFQSGTINSFCQNIIVNHFQDLGFTAPPRILPEEKRKRIINDLLEKYPRISGWQYSQRSDSSFVNGTYSKSALKQLGNIFSLIKREQLTYEKIKTESSGTVYGPMNAFGVPASQVKVIFEMYDEFEKTLKNLNLLEFEDHLNYVEKLYEMHPDLFEEMGFKHILVDEFQDTDYPQIQLLQKMIDTTCFKSFMAVGDDSQSIFGFRHTSPEFMINFENYFGRFTDFSLVENHRSTKNIVDFANSVSAKSMVRVEKDLIATKPDGGLPKVQGYYSQKQEVDAIAADIARRWEAGERDIAVLMSERSELHVVASALAKYNIPSVLMCRVPFVENSRVAALQTFYDSYSGKGTQGFADYQNVMLNGALAGATADQIDENIEIISETVMSTDRGLSTFKEFAKNLDPDERDDCYQEFLEKIDFCKDMDELDEFWQEFKIYGKDSEYKREGKYEGVCLNTIHSAKGLEWDTTYLSLSKLDKAAMHQRGNTKDRDETIRKFFVGATRARENLIMSGEYVLKMDNHGALFNDYVKMAYDLLGKPYEYNYGEYRAVREQEKQEAIDTAMNVAPAARRTTYGNEIAAAIQRHTERVAARRQETYNAVENRTAYSLSNAPYDVRRPSNSGGTRPIVSLRNNNGNSEETEKKEGSSKDKEIDDYL